MANIELTVAPSVINYTVDTPYKIVVDAEQFRLFLESNNV